MIKLLSLLKENYEQVDNEVNQLFMSTKDDSFQNFLERIKGICDKYGINYTSYLAWLKNKRLSENTSNRK